MQLIPAKVWKIIRIDCLKANSVCMHLLVLHAKVSLSQVEVLPLSCTMIYEKKVV